MAWWWNKKSKAAAPPETFLGIRSGMTEKEVASHLRADGVKIQVMSDPDGLGGSVYAEGPEWHVYVSLDEVLEVAGRRGRWRLTPSGMENGVAWLRERIDEYGLPDQHALLAPDHHHRLHTSHLEFRGAPAQEGEQLHPTLTFYREKNDWSVREDWDRHYFERKDGGFALAQYRRRLDALKTKVEERSVKMDGAMEQLYRSTSSRGVEGLAEFIVTTNAWLNARMIALDALAPLVESVPVFDLFDVVERTDKLLGCDVWDREEIHDGAFVIASWDVGVNLVEPLHRLGIATGIHAKQLTYKPRRGDRRETLEIEEHVSWLPGPFAEQLLREQLRPYGCYVLPAMLDKRVSGAKEDLPPPPEEEKGPRPRKYTPPITPIRLSSGGASVYLNSNGTIDELRDLAHALLAAKLERRSLR